MKLELEDLTAARPCPPDAADLSAACKGVARSLRSWKKSCSQAAPFIAERGRQLVKALRLREAALGSAAYRQGMQDAARLSRRLDELLGAERK